MHGIQDNLLLFTKIVSYWRVIQTPHKITLFPVFASRFGLDGKESACNAETRVWFLGWEDPLEKGMATHSSILPGESHGQRSLVGYSPWGHKELDTLSD